MKETLINHWEKLLFLVMLVALIVVWSMYTSKQAELKTIEGLISMDKTIKSIESKMDDIKKRELELYPALEVQLKLVSVDRKKIQDALNKLKTKEEISKDVKTKYEKISDSDIINEFNAMGYPAELISK